MSLADLNPAQKEELVVSLSALLLQDSGVDMSAENLEAVIKVRLVFCWRLWIVGGWVDWSVGFALWVSLWVGGWVDWSVGVAAGSRRVGKLARVCWVAARAIAASSHFPIRSIRESPFTQYM